MWVQLDSDNNIVAEYTRPRPIRVGDIQYPRSVFQDVATLLSFDIYPVMRVQLNAPEDTVGWTSSSADVVMADHVRREVTWVQLPDHDQRRADRDAKLIRQEFFSKRVAFVGWMADNGFYRETEMVGGDFLRFETWYDAQLAETP